MKLKRFKNFNISESDKFVEEKKYKLHINLIDKYRENGHDVLIEEDFDNYKHKIIGFTEKNNTHNLEKGDIIEFTGGYNNDIRYTTKILGFDSEGNTYLLWDSYWYPIRIDDVSRSVKIVKKIHESL